MSNVDNRIVQMNFDNKQFENGIQTSIKSLDNLKKGLNLEKSANSLKDLDKVGRSFSLHGISEGVDALNRKFSTLGIIGITAIQNITNSALNAGKRIASALTVDPIKTGLEEYETKMNAITTILTNTASKGTDLDDVNRVLNDLNQYADKTIYNFAEMTRNIGTFTAAGVDLEPAAVAIKGIANLAAGSGSNAQQAATAMYQLSQALAAGSVKLMDWNSVVNAGMGGELFQNALKETARQMGIVVDSSVPFRESLQSGWITSEVLIKTLSKFAEDEMLLKAATQVKTFTQLLDTMKESIQSGWAVSWEHIIGNREEAASLFTAINDAFSSVAGGAADARNEMLLFWKDNGGRAAVLEGISNALIGLASVLEPIEKAFRAVFPAMTGERLVEISKRFGDLTANFKIGSNLSENLRRTFEGLFSIVDLVGKGLGFIAKAAGLVLKALFPIGGGILEITGNMGAFLTSINKAVEDNNIFGQALNRVAKALTSLRTAVKETIGFVANSLERVGDSTLSFGAGLTSAVANAGLLTKSMNILKTALDRFKNVIHALSDIDLSGLFGFTNKLTPAFNDLSDSSDKAKESFKGFGGVLEGITGSLREVSNFIKDTFGPVLDVFIARMKEINLLDIAAILGGGGIFMLAKAIKDSLGSIDDIAGNVSQILNGLTGSLEAFQTKLKADALVSIAIAIGILAASIVALSLIDANAMNRALFSLGILMTQLSVALLALQKATFAAKGVAPMLISLGVGVLMLALAMKSVSDLDSEKLLQGVKGLSAVLATLALFTKFTSNTTAIQGSLIGISISVLLLSKSIEKLSSLDPVKMEQGIKALSASLMSLLLFIKLMGTPERLLSIGAGLIAIGAAMNLVAGSIAIFGSLPLDTLTKGVTGMAAALMALALSTRLIPNEASMIAIGIGLNLMALSLYAVAGAIAILGNVSFETLSRGVAAMAASLMVLAIAARAMTGTATGAASMTLMAIAINMLAPALAILGNLSLTTIGIALVALAGSFTVLGLSALILKPLAPIIMTLSASIAVLGAGVYIMGIGLVGFAAGLAALAAGGGALIVAFTKIAMTIINLIPDIARKMGEGVITFAQAIKDGIPKILDVIKALATSLVKLFGEIIPPIVDAAFQFVVMLLDKMVEYGPRIIEAGNQILMNILRGILDNIKELAEMGVEIIVEFLDGVATKIPDIIETGVNIVIGLVEGISDAIPRLSKAGFDLIIDFIDGIARVASEETPRLVKAFVNLAVSIIEGIVMGLLSGVGVVVQSILDVGKAIIGGFKSLLGINSPSTIFTTLGEEIVNGLIAGIKNMISAVGETVTDLGTSVINTAKKVLGIKSPSRMFREIGRNIAQGTAVGIKDDTKKAVDATTDMSKEVAKASGETIKKTSADTVKKSNEAAKNAFDKSIEWIEERKYYNLLSLAEELAAWERVQARYLEGSEERKRADREVYRVKQELEKKAFNDSVSWIDERKYYNDLSLKEELRAWELVQARYLEGTEERKRADREVYRVTQEINRINEDYTKRRLEIERSSADERKRLEEDYQRRTKEVQESANSERKRLEEEYNSEKIEINNASNEKRKKLEDDYYAKTVEIKEKLEKDIQDVTKKYEDAVISRTKSLYSAYSLFEEVGIKDPVSGDQLIVNLQGQVNEFESWQENISELAKKGIDEGLLKELTDMGPKSAVQIDALNKLSSEKLDTYVALWRTKHANAKNQAILELENMRIETLTKIDEMRTQSNVELDAYRATWHQQMETLKADTSRQLAELKADHLEKMRTLNIDTSNQLSQLRTEWETKMKEINENTSRQLSQLQTEWSTKMGIVKATTESQVSEMNTNIQTSVTEMREETEKEFKTLAENIQTIMSEPDWFSLGVNIVEGMRAGIRDRATALAREAAAVAMAALAAAKFALGVRSPSRKFMEVGMYAVLGLAEGLRKFSHHVVQSSTDVGNEAIFALQSTLSNISKVVDGKLDSEPVIRPVIDLSNVEEGSKRINTLFAQNRGLSMGPVMSKIPSVQKNNSGDNFKMESAGNADKQTSISFVQNNYSPKPLSRIDIYRQTKNQISVMKGVTGTV